MCKVNERWVGGDGEMRARGCDTDTGKTGRWRRRCFPGERYTAARYVALLARFAGDLAGLAEQ